MAVFEVHRKAAFTLKEFFDGRKLQGLFSQDGWVVAQLLEVGGDDFLLIKRMAMALLVRRVGIEQGQQSDLFALVLKAISQRSAPPGCSAK